MASGPGSREGAGPGRPYRITRWSHRAVFDFLAAHPELADPLLDWLPRLAADPRAFVTEGLPGLDDDLEVGLVQVGLAGVTDRIVAEVYVSDKLRYLDIWVIYFPEDATS